MASIIKIKRGLEINRLNYTPDEGELIYTTDQKKLYIGDGVTVGGNPISSSDLTLNDIISNDFEINDWIDGGDIFYYDFVHNRNTKALIVNIYKLIDVDEYEIAIYSFRTIDDNTVRLVASKIPDERFNGRLVVSGSGGIDEAVLKKHFLI